MVVKNEINEIGEKIDLHETETNLVNNVIPKPEEFGEPSRRNTHFLRPRYVPAGRTNNFSFRFVPRKTTTYEEIGCTSISQTGYILNIDGARNKEKIFEQWKRGMNSVLNLNTTWTAVNFHSFSGTVADWYDSLSEDGKNTLRTMETPVAMFKSLCKEIETEFIGAKIDSKEKAREWQRKINNIELWNMRYLENYIVKFNQYYYKLGHNETNIGVFYEKLPYSINFIINEKYMAWLERTDVVNTLGSIISYLSK